MSTRPERPLHGPLQSFDLEAEVLRLREEEEWQAGRRNSVTLRKGGGLNPSHERYGVASGEPG